MWEMFNLTDKELIERDDEISCLPYHQLNSKDQVHVFFIMRLKLYHDLLIYV